jgi:hypothetical protein
MFVAAADGSDAVTIGLGIIAGALFFGEFAFFKWIYGPALDRADRQLQSAEDRHKAEMETERARYAALEEKTDRYYGVLEDKALPALTAATMTVAQFQTLIAEMQSEQERQNREREIEEAVQRGKRTA